MCDFLSFLIVHNQKDEGWKLVSHPEMNSHSDTRLTYEIHPEDSWEVEWTAESDNDICLDIRLPEDCKFTEDQIRSWLLAQYPTRLELFKEFLKRHYEAGDYEGGEHYWSLDINGLTDQDFELPKNLKLWTLDVSNTGITKLPEGLELCSSLYINYCKLTEIPLDTRVGGNIRAWGMKDKIKRFPRAGTKRIQGGILKD